MAVDAGFFVDVLGARLVFTVEAMGARVAMIQLTEQPPHILLTDHLDGERPVLIYRVDDLSVTLDTLEKQGWQRTEVFEIPHGPCTSFTTPAGHRIAVYQATRPGATDHFAGRFDFSPSGDSAH